MMPHYDERVTVLQEDIDHGKYGNCRECPIARAGIREFIGRTPLRLGTECSMSWGGYLTVYQGMDIRMFRSVAAARFADAFDDRQAVYPQSILFMKAGK